MRVFPELVAAVLDSQERRNRTSSASRTAFISQSLAPSILGSLTEHHLAELSLHHCRLWVPGFCHLPLPVPLTRRIRSL
jgi:hypothetical protein